jgi:hypothetical protein
MKRAAALLAVVLSSREARAEPPKLEDPQGAEVDIVSSKPDTMIFVAKGTAASDQIEDPFVRLGIAPRKLRLPPGAYSIESDGPTQSGGHADFWVDKDRPLRIEVRPGDASLKTFGGVLTALGVTSMLAGIVAIISISADDSGDDRWAIGLPLVLGGAGAVGGGIGLSIAGATRIEVTKR